MLATIVVACTNEKQQGVTFGYKVVEQGSMTRGTAKDAVTDLCESTLPEHILVQMTNSSSFYSIITGQESDIKVGTYTAIANYAPEHTTLFSGVLDME